MKNLLGKNITTCGFNRKVSVQGGGWEGEGALWGLGGALCGNGPLGH